MDIVKRAYLKTLEEYKAEPGWPDVSDFEGNVRREIIRLIKVRAYSGRDWPRELGPIPDKLRAKRYRPDYEEVEAELNEDASVYKDSLQLHYGHGLFIGPPTDICPPIEELKKGTKVIITFRNRGAVAVRRK